ncbi:GtrA family protein [Shewanella abyssi]|uniref:GtrA family protein n=1 Tax=Shewanella abyssi TaxID=311789 RepID=UPI00200BF788|nr:GtrA family protein [Shewanella abyssi]MCL1048661.1 GtrA family protein [Shewanella abyssi]
MSQLWRKHQQEARFLLVGASVFVADAVLFFLLFEQFALPLMLARVAAFSVAVVLSWFANRCWTFSSREQVAKGRQLLMSALVSSTAAIANISAFYLISLLLGQSLLDMAFAFSVGVLAGLVFNWFGANFWTFRALNID